MGRPWCVEWTWLAGKRVPSRALTRCVTNILTPQRRDRGVGHLSGSSLTRRRQVRTIGCDVRCADRVARLDLRATMGVLVGKRKQRDGRQAVMLGFAEAAAERGEYFFYARIPEA